MTIPCSVVDDTGSDRDVLLDWSGPATAGQLAEALGSDGPVSYRGRQVDATTPLDELSPREGDRLGVGATPPTPLDLGAQPALRVVAGRGAGTVYPLPAGSVVVGRGANADVALIDPDVSRRHCLLERGSGGTTVVTDLTSRNGTHIDGERLTEPTPLAPGALLEVGNSLLVYAAGEPAATALTAAPDGTVDYNRPPRIRPASRTPEITWPSEPTKPEGRKFPLVTMIAPLAIGGVAYAVTNSPLTLLFALMTPVMYVGNIISDKRSGKTRYRKQKADYDKKLADVQRRLATELAAEKQRRRTACPDPAALLATATGPRNRLWERRRADADALVCRVGMRDLPAQVKLSPAGTLDEPLEQPTLPWLPVTVPLADVGVLGVTGARADAQALARSLVGQVATLSSPADVGVVLCSVGDPAARQAWEWLRWLPHARPALGQSCQALLGVDADTIATRINELVALVEARTKAAQEARGRLSLAAEQQLVVVLDGAHDLRALPGVPMLLADGPAVGVFAVCVDETEARLPEECAAVVSVDEKGFASVRRTGGDDLDQVLADLVPPSWAQTLGRALAPLRDAGGEREGGRIPDSARLLDILALDPPTTDALAARWTLSGRSTSAPVGVGQDGTVSLDVRRDGPHALVAGTTGAGKSEFLQSLVASLAVANRPDAMTFVLVDYKGGSAFKDCARLPHTVGLVTDLDGHLVERALESLSAELRRRETVLGAAGAKDVEDYVDAGEPGGPMPRLMLVIDEFASLVEELPDFVRGLVGIAQRGRSLGVHLVLATQRPGGVVSPEIRANTNLRIALRVTDPAESADVIDAPDAARIAKSTPGRAYARTGHTSLLAFQSGRVGGRRPGAVTAAPAEVHVTDVPFDRAGYPLPARAVIDEPEDDATDLYALVEAVRAAGETLGVPAQPSPWLEPLPALLSLPDVPAPEPLRSGGLPAAPYGLVDLPDRQQVSPAVLDVEHGGHLAVAGAPRSGRSTLLRTIAGSVATTYDPGDVHVYGLDCGNGALLPVGRLPHCGTVVSRTETERGGRLLDRLSAEVSSRQERLAAEGFADVAEQRAAAAAEDRLPYLLLLVDRWEGFTTSYGEIDNGRHTDTFLRLLREGPSAGLRIVVAGDRSVLLGKLSGAIEDRLCLRLADRSDYSLAGLRPRKLPDDFRAGQAFRTADERECQIAVLRRPGADATDPSGAAQAAALTAIGEQHAGGASDGRRPFRVDVLPARLPAEQARALDGWAPGPLAPIVGVGGDELAPIAVDLETYGPGFTVAGPRRSGRSTTLLGIAMSVLEAGSTVVALAPRPSPLRALDGHPGVAGVVTDSDPDPQALVEVLNTVTGHLVVVVDDAELLHPSDVQPLLQQVLRDGRDQGHAMVVGGTTEELLRAMRGFTFDARSSRAGLILTPESHLQGELLGLRLPRSAVFTGPAGRGFLALPGRSTLVQVPLVTAGEISAQPA